MDDGSHVRDLIKVDTSNSCRLLYVQAGTSTTPDFSMITSLSGLSRELVFVEDDVSPVQPGSFDSGNEELRAVGVFASISHGQPCWSILLQTEVFVFEPQPEIVICSFLSKLKSKAQNRETHQTMIKRGYIQAA